MKKSRKNTRNQKSKNYDTIVRTYKFLAFPKNSTKKYLHHVFEAVRNFWNMANQERFDAYRKRKIIFLTYGLPIDRSLPKENQAVAESQDNCVKYIKQIFPEYCDINTGIFSSVIKQLDTSWINGYKTLRQLERLHDIDYHESLQEKKKKSKEDSKSPIKKEPTVTLVETDHKQDRVKFNDKLKGAHLRRDLPENHQYVNTNRIENLKFIPGYKRKIDDQSFTLKNSGWRLDGDKLYLTMGKDIKSVIKFRKYREMEGTIKTVSVIHDSTHRWWVVFTCNEIPKKERKEFPPKESVGIDFGVRNVLTDSDGKIIENPGYLERATLLVADAQRRVDKYKENKKSKKYIQAKKWLAIAHKKVADRRSNDACEKAKEYTDKYHTLFLEDTDLVGIMKRRTTKELHLDGNTRNNEKKNLKKTYDAGIGVYRNKLIQRAEYYGNSIVMVPAYYTSQTCFHCGHCLPKGKRLPLSKTVYVCEKCGVEVHRDINAALVIQKRGKKC